MVTLKAIKSKDTTIRRRTVLEFIQSQIEVATQKHPIKVQKETANGAIKFTDLTYYAEKPLLGAFDLIRCRVFRDVETFAPGIDCGVNLSSSVPIPREKKIAAIERLIGLYGPDNSGYEGLEAHEYDMIEAGEFWTGRNWQFNQTHALLDLEDKNQKMSYWLSIDDMEDYEGFKVSIIGYDNLVELFGLS